MEGVIGAPRGDRDVLDLGCGTGLCGQAFRGYASRLVGTDLSAGMIAKARERGVYNELYCEDILVTLERMPGQFDVILSADVFVYIGDLARVFDAAEAALRPGGWFAFSVERGAAGTTYALHSANRYTHSADYVRDLARCNGLQEAKFADVVLRVQNGEPVAGYVVLLQREAVRGMPDAYG
jgi:predicted TPR repeat methyltransferase